MNTTSVRARDISVENHFSILLVRPLSSAAEAWIEENVSGESRFFAGALVVEPRYVVDLVEGMLSDGLLVS